MFQAFQFGPFILWTGLLLLLIGIWLSSEFFFRLALSANLSLQHMQDFWWWYVLAFVLGGRLVAVVAEYRVYLRDPLRIVVLWDGSFSFLGAALGIAVVLFIGTHFQRSTFLQWLDVLVPATTLGLCLSWLGAFFAGQAYGKPTDAFFGVTYDAPNVRFAVPVHPVQLYYAIFYFLLTFLLLVVRKKAKRVGTETLVGILLASLATFSFEFFRGDFAIPVFATLFDFIMIGALFLSLGVFAVVELRLTPRGTLLYELFLFTLSVGYLIARPWLELETYELRFSQLLTVLALLATVVYVVFHRSKYPHL